MSKIKQYSSYKDSKIEGIRKIPEHWKINKIKNLFQIYNGSTPKSNEKYWDGKICWITPADYKTESVYINQSNRTITKEGYDSCGTHLVKKGSIIISTRAPIGTVAIANKKLCTNQGCKSLEKIKELNTKYYYYFFTISKNELENLGKGTTFMELSTSDLNNFLITTPSFEEQNEIVKYLDHKTSTIEENITKNKKLIELLKEKRTTIINQAVTKGLNPETQMKESGIEWIGKIPEHWIISRLKFNISKKAQYGANKEPEKNDEKQDVRYIRITDINENGFLKDSKVYLSREDANEFILNKNDILFARSGATVGKAYLHQNTSEICCYAGYLIRYITKKTLNSKYLLYFTMSKSYWAWIHYVSTQSTIENVSADKYNELIVPLPDYLEQTEIIEYLDSKTNKIDITIEKIERNIELLEEYKESLIHHVVTGKIDVRCAEV